MAYYKLFLQAFWNSLEMEVFKCPSIVLENKKFDEASWPLDVKLSQFY